VIEECGYTNKIKLGLDCAASEFYDRDKENYTLNDRRFTSGELLDFYLDLVSKYPIISIEDPFAEDDWEALKSITTKIGDTTQIVGDDLFVTNIVRLQQGIELHAANCLLLKVNQIGTLTEACNAFKLAFNNDYGAMVSHRSGETEDTFIADLAVGLRTGQIKTGAPARSSRTAKYNKLLRIEEELGDRKSYAGYDFRCVKLDNNY